MAFGVVGAAVQSANAASSRVFYEVDDSEKAEIRQGGFEKMEELLQRYPELLERYQKEAFKEHIEIVGKYLQAIKQQE